MIAAKRLKIGTIWLEDRPQREFPVSRYSLGYVIPFVEISAAKGLVLILSLLMVAAPGRDQQK